ncbi:ChaN family lipoprotein [Aliidiomarina celeris]|uniref:ChaN family lipoprotein n=1 Tax=Aliidiomarina celeris TaxID=2249428 RepID=UPI000DE9A072|nr:ChaN family lipoprotein [Aliidiomarina celeris]
MKTMMAYKQGVLLKLVAVWLSFLLAGCTLMPSQDRASRSSSGPGAISFQGTEHRNNALVGKFWSPATEEFVPWREVAHYLPRGGWVMLGEQHDHPDHHLVQSYFIYYLAERGLLGHVAMEMVAANQQAAINAYQGTPERVTPQDLDWPSQGWPWERYENQVKAALELSPKLIFGDLSDAQKNAIKHNNEAIAHYSEAHTEQLADLIVASHCNMFSAERALPMVDMQIARDQIMAQQMIAYALPDQVGVFIAGSGHVRTDLGAPLWMADNVPVRTIILVGVSESEDPKAYQQGSADLLFFVPGIEQVDYCAAFKRN